MVFFLGTYPCQRITYFSDGSDPICCTMRSAVYSCTSPVGLFERLRLPGGDVGTSNAELVCGRVHVWL